MLYCEVYLLFLQLYGIEDELPGLLPLLQRLGWTLQEVVPVLLDGEEVISLILIISYLNDFRPQQVTKDGFIGFLTFLVMALFGRPLGVWVFQYQLVVLLSIVL